MVIDIFKWIVPIEELSPFERQRKSKLLRKRIVKKRLKKRITLDHSKCWRTIGNLKSPTCQGGFS